MNDLYQRIYLAGEDEDASRILAILSEIKSGKLANDLRLVNYYHEVPVSYTATVLSVEAEAAELLVHQHQAVAISLTKLTVLKSRHFPRDVIASVAYVNVKRSQVVVNRLSYGIVRAERRMSVRVELDERMTGTFTSQSGTISGVLQDISLTGLSLTLSEPLPLPPSEEGEITLNLPNGTVTVPASLLKESIVENGYRVIVQITPGRAEEGSISRFIMQRQVEIIRKLKDIADLSHKPGC